MLQILRLNKVRKLLFFLSLGAKASTVRTSREFVRKDFRRKNYLILLLLL
jgi:hypothetical protein